MDSEIKEHNPESILHRWQDLSQLQRRLLIATLVSLDAIIGLLYQAGIGNGIDAILFGNLPNDMVWLFQSVQLISMGFFFVKIVFDDLAQGWFRISLMVLSPLFLLLTVLFTIELLLLGLDSSAEIFFNLSSIGFSTLTWSSTYLAIAVGCTLTYSVQRYGNFAQSEFFMLGMYVAAMMMWMDYFFPLVETSKDGVLVWSVLVWTLIGAFVLTGLAGVIIDRLVFRGFRDRKSSADVMMIASLGVALILRAIVYLRFGAGTKLFEPDIDWRIAREQQFEVPTLLTKFNLGDRSIASGETYIHGSCEQVDGVSSQIVSEGSKPLADVYSVGPDCVTELTSNYAYYNAAMPFVIFASVGLLMLLLTKTRLGRRMRAVADNPELAASCGINVERVHMTSAFLSAGISGIGGAIFAMTIRYSPETGFTLLLPAFAVIVLGTIGSIRGAVFGAVLIGFVRSISSPILMGIGGPLERSNYANLSEVMPYVMIIAILFIMPKGIGDAFDKWNIKRTRMRAEDDFVPNTKRASWLGVFLAPTGIHHFSVRNSIRGQRYLLSTLIAYIVYKFSAFVKDNSIANDSTLHLLTGGDSSISLSHAPSKLLLDQQEAWLSLMQFEQGLVEFMSGIGFLLWPTVPVVLYLIAWWEAYHVLQGKEITPSNRFNDVFSTLSNRYASISSSLGSTWRKATTALDDRLSFIAVKTQQWTDSVKTKVSGAFVQKRDTMLEQLNMPYGRESGRGSWALFAVLTVVMAILLYWLPVANSDQISFVKTLQISNVLITFTIFAILALSLNLHTGITGQLNFGVIFFASIGAITVGLLTAPKELHGYDWPIVYAVIFSMILGALAGWLLAYPTARLRSDYFAIITISLGEIVRVLLGGEPLLRAGSWGSAVGISRYKLPLQERWFCGSDVPVDANNVPLSPLACSKVEGLDSMAATVGELLNLGQPAPYMFVLATIGLVGLLLTWWLLNTVLASPWGRILRAIREDEEVAQHHGHDVLRHKAASLALGGAIAAFAGALWAWKLTGFQPSFMSPANTTFLVWAAFIIGGVGNNRGMIIGASIIVLMEFVFNVLVAAQGSSDLPLNEVAANIDNFFGWLVLEQVKVMWICVAVMILAHLVKWESVREIFFWLAVIFALASLFFDERSIEEAYPSGIVRAGMAYVKVLLIGLLIVFSLRYNPKGLLPEVPYRPSHPAGKGVEEQ
ncbi:MAG TPA: ABC transporter permease [Poseidonia sp.]|nr:ABC transporter permease [Poseidonia sp.]